VDHDLIFAVVVASALIFDFTNGFHDTANVVATSISTRALAPRAAVALAALLNFAGAFISLKVAATIGKGIVASGSVTLSIVFAALAGAIAWNLITWSLGLPSSSSHALIGGLVGSMLVAHTGAVNAGGLLGKVVIPAVLAPALAFGIAVVAILAIYRLVGRLRPGPTTKSFRRGQIVSGGLLALAHGTNDAQKTMGVITLALIAHGDLAAKHFAVPTWVVISAAGTIALGTYSGGWRIIKTMGTRIIRMDVAQGFTAQTAGAAVILAASHVGYPLSTTHVISGGIMGAGAAKRFSAVRWGIAGNIVVAWVLTLPAAGATAAAVYALTRLFGGGALGAIAVIVLLLIAVIALRMRRVAPAAGTSPLPQGT
jgi:PiT family inorganic phosphate transporter